MRFFAILGFIIVISGCASVTLSDAGREVRVLNSTPSDLCEFRGVLDVKDNNLYFDHNSQRTGQLNTIRNAVAEIGGDAFVPVNLGSTGGVYINAQVDVYRCSQDSTHEDQS